MSSTTRAGRPTRQDEPEPNYPRRRALVALCIAIILVIGVGVPVALLGPVPAAKAVPETLHAETTSQPHVQAPGFGYAAIGAVGMPGVLETSGNQSPHQMASITKMIMSLVVLQKKPLSVGEQGPTISYTQHDVEILQQVLADDGSYAPVQAGWKLSEYQSFQATLLPSANNYAESMAIWAYGSMPKFLTAARAWLKANGLAHTTIVDANGLSAQDVATPSDVVELGKLVMANPVLTGIVKQQSVTLPQVGQLENTNDLLGTDGVDGIKTGTASDSYANLLFTADKRVGSRTVRLVGVILGAANHALIDAAVPAYLDSVAASLHDVVLAKKGQTFATYRTDWGGTVRAVAAKDVDRIVWGDAKVTGTVSASEITGGNAGQRVGTVSYVVNRALVTVPLQLDQSLLAAPVYWRLTHPIR